MRETTNTQTTFQGQRPLPPVVMAVRVFLAEHGTGDVETVRKHLHDAGYRPSSQLLGSLPDRYPDLFDVGADGSMRLRDDGRDDCSKQSDVDGESGWWISPATPPPARLEFSDVIVIDLETTGLDHSADHIRQIAAQDLAGDRRLLLEVDHPDRAPGGATVVSVADAIVALRDFVGAARALAGHRLAQFDLPFIEASAKRAGTSAALDLPCIDLHELSLLVEPSLPGRTLGELCEHAGITLDQPHQADHDAAATAQAIEWFLREVDPEDPNWALTIRLLEEAGHPLTALLPLAQPPDNLDGAFRLAPDDLGAIPVRQRHAASTIGATRQAFTELADRDSRHRHRKPQLDMADAVANSLETGRSLAVEAPTGTGKSLAYLIAAAEWSARTGRQAVVATHTKLLQRQLRDDAEKLASLDMLAVPFQQLFGISNYICPREVSQTIETRDAAGSEWFAVAVAVRAIGRTVNGVWDDVTDGLRTRTDLSYARSRMALRASPNSCERTQCPHVHHCPAYRQRSGAGRHSAGVVSVNHALVGAWVSFAQKGGAAPGSPFAMNDDTDGSSVSSKVRRPPGAIVFDEAHNLEDSLTSAWTTSTGGFDLRVTLGSIYGRHGAVRLTRDALRKRGLPTDTADELRRLKAQVDSAVDELSDVAAQYLHEFGGAEMQAELRWATVRTRPEYRSLATAALVCSSLLGRLQAALIDASSALDPAEDAPADKLTRRARFRIEAAVADIGARREVLGVLNELPDHHRFVHVLGIAGDLKEDGATPEDLWVLERIPIHVSERFADDVVARLHATVLTSATLRVGGQFNFLSQRLGIPITDEPGSFTTLTVDTPFDYDEQSAVVLTSHLPLPVPGAERAFCEDLAADQVGLLSLTRGRMLTLFAARRRMEQVAELVRRREHALAGRGVELLVQGEDTFGQITRRFRTNPGAVLYGLRSFWEGFDAPGETLSFLVIEKPPYPHPGDLLHSARQRAIADAGGDPFLEYVVPQTAIALAQGFGRLIRREDDRGVAVMCDRRLLNPTPANQMLLDTLPTRTVFETQDRDEAWTKAIEFVDGEPPDLSKAILLDVDDLAAVLAALRLEPGEDPVPKLKAAAAQLFDIEELRVEQLALMLAVLQGRDALGFLPTGYGKSLCFQLPALLHPEAKPVVVVSPLVALIKDQVDDLRARRGLRSVRGITGRTSAAERDDTLRDLAAGKIRLLYVSPERLVRDGTLSTALSLVQLNALVVDEAHCISSWGHDFRPEFRQVVKPVLQFERSPRLGLTATATTEVETDLVSTMDLTDPVVIRSPVDRSDIRYWVQSVANERDRTRELLRFVMYQGNRPGIVYASRRALTEELAWLLRQAGVTARSYHAGMVPEQREAVQDDFLSGTTQIIVATKAFGMGVNKPDIGWVVHFDLPDSLESYAQEAGRAARASELEGDCLLLYSKSDVMRRKKLAGRARLSDNGIAARVLALVAAAPTRGDAHLFDPEELADEAGIEVDDLNVVISWLEQAGSVERLQDATVRGTLSIARREPADREERHRFFRIVHECLRVRIGRERRFDLAELASAVPMSPDDLEVTLTTWSLHRFVTYRSTARAWRVKVRQGNADAERLEAIVGRWRDLEQRRVRQIETYVQRRTCRRRLIATTFGDDPLDCHGSGGRSCDVCTGSEPYWYDIPSSAVPDPETMVDVELVVLQAVRWATWGRDRGRTQQYSESNLKAALIGLEAIGTRPLPNGLLRCPQFGAARYLRGSQKVIDGAVDRLVSTRLIRRAEASYREQTYSTLELTEHGEHRLGGRRG